MSMLMPYAAVNTGLFMGATASFHPSPTFEVLSRSSQDSAYSNDGLDDDGLSRSINRGGIRIRSLGDYDFDSVNECINLGFKTELRPDALRIFLDQNAYRPNLSAGAFVDGSMVGLWLLGARTLGAKTHAHGSGTTIVPDWRGRGIAILMGDYILATVKNAGIDRFTLITDDDNRAAIGIYTSLGFEISRSLMSLKLERPDLSLDGYGANRIHTAPLGEVENLASSLLDYRPSWRNTFRALKDVDDSTVAAVVRRDGGVLAYGVFQPELGRLAQLGALSMSANEEMVAVRSLLDFYFDNIARDNDELEMVELPSDATRSRRLLTSARFNIRRRHVEMAKSFGR